MLSPRARDHESTDLAALYVVGMAHLYLLPRSGLVLATGSRL